MLEEIAFCKKIFWNILLSHFIKHNKYYSYFWRVLHLTCPHGGSAQNLFHFSFSKHKIIFPQSLNFFVRLNGKVLFSLNCCHPLPTWAGASNSGIILTPLILAYWIRSWISFLQKYLFYHSPPLSHFPLYSVVLKIKTIFFFYLYFSFFWALESGHEFKPVFDQTRVISECSEYAQFPKIISEGSRTVQPIRGLGFLGGNHLNSLPDSDLR